MEQGNPYPNYQTQEPAARRRGKKRKVAKDGFKRGSVEALALGYFVQLAVDNGASPEFVSLLTPDNVGVVIGFAVLVTRVLEALIADGND